MSTELVPFSPPAMLTTTDVNLADFDLSFDRVINPSGGGLTFGVPGDDPERPDPEPALEGVIVHHHPSAVLWLEKGSEKPDAWSNDGVHQFLREGTVEKCKRMGLPTPAKLIAECPFFQWGSANLTKPEANPKGKAGTNQYTLYLLPSGALLPYEVTVTPSGLRGWNDYVLKRVLAKGLSPAQVVTRISLVGEKSDGGDKYSRQVFALVGALGEEEAAQLREYTDMVKATIAKRGNGAVEPVAVEASVAPSLEAMGATQVSSDFSAPDIV